MLVSRNLHTRRSNCFAEHTIKSLSISLWDGTRNAIALFLGISLWKTPLLPLSKHWFLTTVSAVSVFSTIPVADVRITGYSGCPKFPKLVFRVPMAHGAKAIMLIIGKDEALLRTQALIFESAEYVVVQAGGQVQALKLLKNWSFGIVVIDNTLSRDERNLLIAAVRSESPETRIVVFHASADAENVDLVMDSRDGAAIVLAKVNALFPKPPQTAPGTDAALNKAETKPN